MIVRRTTLWLSAVVVGLFVGIHGWLWLGEHRALAALPPAPSGAPNVLLITLDTVRAQSLSLYGYSRPTTPRLERLAKSGVRFEHAFSSSPWTLPSHASMFTGYSPGELSVDWYEPLDKTHPTLAEVLSKRGYVTAGFVANPEYCSYETGLDRGFVHYEDYPESLGAIVVNSSLGKTIADSPTLRRIVGYYDLLDRKTAPKLNHDFLDWLSRNDRRPFFAFLNYYDAHEPYLPREPFDKEFGPPTPQTNLPAKPLIHASEPSGIENMSLQDIQKDLMAYEGSIAYLDHHLGVLFDELKRRGLLENTLVIITSDHGELFGEHGLLQHGNSLYLEELRVPLLILFPPRVPADRTIREPVSLRELSATVIDLTKPETDAGFSFPGASLARYWNGTSSPGTTIAEPVLSEVKKKLRAPQARAPVSKGGMRSLIMDHYHYIKNGDGSEEVYDFETDPKEKHDLVRSEEGRRVTELCRATINAIGARKRSSK